MFCFDDLISRIAFVQVYVSGEIDITTDVFTCLGISCLILTPHTIVSYTSVYSHDLYIPPVDTKPICIYRS